MNIDKIVVQGNDITAPYCSTCSRLTGMVVFHSAGDHGWTAATGRVVGTPDYVLDYEMRHLYADDLGEPEWEVFV